MTGAYKANVNVQPRGSGVPGTKVERAPVDIDSPDPRGRRPGRHHQRERTVAAAEVEQVAASRRGGSRLEQQPGPRVQAAGGEDAGVGSQLQVGIGQHDVDDARPMLGGRLLSEVLAAHWC